MSLENERTLQTCSVLTNAGQLVASIVKEVAGNDIASSINGSEIGTGLICSLANQRIIEQLQACKKQ